MNKEQLTELVIVPTLKKIPKGFSELSVVAIQMIIAHESLRGEYLKQIKGPALGLIGMEPDTHRDTWRYGDSIWDNAINCGIIDEWQFDRKMPPAPERLIYDLEYNVFMARQKLFMFTEALPDSHAGISKYLKKYWNAGGKASAKEYLDDYNLWK